MYACNVSLQARNARPEIYEVKVSRADFLSDLANPAKRAGYTELAQAVYFCTPAGLVDPAELPPEVGLICESAPSCFKIVRGAKRRKGFELHPDTLMTLVIKQGCARPLF